jgi:exonuclease VII small subunit
MRIFTCLFFVFSAVGSLFGQDLHIYYNVHKDSTWYMKNGKSVSDLEVKKDRTVFFHLVEFNNFIYKAAFDPRQTSNPYSVDGTDSTATAGLMPSAFSGFLQEGASSLPLFNIPGMGTFMSTLSGLGGNTARGALEEVEEVKSELKILEAEKLVINQQITTINQRKKAIALLNGDFTFVNSLYHSPTILPSTIKALSLRYFSDVFILGENDQFDIKNISEYNKKLQELPQLQVSLDQAIKSYEEKYKKLEKSVTKLKNADHGVDELYPLIKKFEVDGPGVYQTLKKYGAEANAKDAVASQSAAGDYTALIQNSFLKYQEVLNNDFSYTHQVKCEDKYLFYIVNLYRKDSLGVASGQAAEPKQTIKVKVSAYTPIRVSSSVGLSAGKFAKIPQKFYIKNDVLTAQDLDPFLPMVTSLIHVGFDFRGVVFPAI